MEVKSECTKEFIYVQVIQRTTHLSTSTSDDASAENPANEAPKITSENNENTPETTLIKKSNSAYADEDEVELEMKDILQEDISLLTAGEVNATKSHEATETTVKTYINKVLNDNNTPQAVVYKVIFHATKTGYVIHFFLFREYGLESPELRRLKWKNIGYLQENGFTLQSEHVMEQLDAFKRKIVSIDDDSEQHWRSVRGSNLCSKFLNWWLIVPRVQWDFFNLLYQMYTFDITHQGFVPKFVHFFTIPTNVMLFMTWLAQFEFLLFGRFGYGAYQVNATTVAFILLATVYMIMGIVRKTAAWGFATTVVILVQTLTGNLWYTVYKVPGNPWYNPTTWGSNPIIWSYIISLIQASSHLFEKQIPPYITGLTHWETAHRFFCKRWRESDNRCCSWQFILLSCACFPIFSVFVAWFSWFHLIGTEVIFLMAGIGYQHSSFTKYFRVIEKAKMTGNPGLDRFPKTDRDLEHSNGNTLSRTNVGMRLNLYGLDDKDATDLEIAKSISTLQIVSKYFRPPPSAEDIECMKAAKKYFKR